MCSLKLGNVFLESPNIIVQFDIAQTVTWAVNRQWEPFKCKTNRSSFCPPAAISLGVVPLCTFVAAEVSLEASFVSYVKVYNAGFVLIKH